MSEEHGWVSAFIANFADEGVNFTPHPTRTKERLSSQPPAPPDSGPKNVLHWRPVYSDISAAGDMGYNTGPFWLTDAQKQIKPQGYFFSVWRKQDDGSWKVVLDVGVSMPLKEPDLNLAWRAARSSVHRAKRPDDPAEQKKAITQLETTASPNALEKLLAVDTRLHTPNLMPILGEKAVLTHWGQQGLESLSWQPIVVESAHSADLAYSYGSYTLGRVSGEKEKGYYGHVWKRDPQGQWRLVVEVLSPLPQEKK
jgi:ketosteroid isomerase-like protein